MQLIIGLGEEDVHKRAMARGKQGGRERSLAELESCFFFDIKIWGILFFPKNCLLKGLLPSKESPEMAERVILVPNPEVKLQPGAALEQSF